LSAEEESVISVPEGAAHGREKRGDFDRTRLQKTSGKRQGIFLFYQVLIDPQCFPMRKKKPDGAESAPSGGGAK